MPKPVYDEDGFEYTPMDMYKFNKYMMETMGFNSLEAFAQWEAMIESHHVRKHVDKDRRVWIFVAAVDTIMPIPPDPPLRDSTEKV